MQAFGMLLLAAATAGDGFGYADPGVGRKKWLRGHLVSTTATPRAPRRTTPPRWLAAARCGAANGRRFTVHQEPDLLP